MKILFAIDYYQAELGYSETHVTRHLAQLGHEVTLFTSNAYFPFPHYEETVGKLLGPRHKQPGQAMEQNVTIIRRPLLAEAGGRAFFTGQKEILDATKPDLVIVNGVLTFNAVRFAQLKQQYGFKLTLFDSHLPSEFQRGSQLLKQAVYCGLRATISPLLNAKADSFIAVQEDTVEVIKNVYGISQPIKIVSLGTDTQLFHYSESERISTRKRHRIAPHDFLTLYTGKVIEAKGVHLLCQAFQTFHSQHSDAKLMIVGEGPQEYLDHCTKLLGGSISNVRWIPFQPVSQLPPLYSAADVAVWPLQESTSMNDAAACSLPFIANHKIGAKERISNNNALLYTQGDPLDLAQKLIWMYKHPQERKALGKRGRELAERSLSWSKKAQEYIF